MTALVTGKEHAYSQNGARGLVLSLVPLLVAALLGLLASANRSYVVAHLDTLQSMVGPHWIDHETDARNSVASVTVKTINSLRVVNNRKASQVVVAFRLQLFGLLGTVVSVGYELRDRLF